MPKHLQAGAAAGGDLGGTYPDPSVEGGVGGGGAAPIVIVAAVDAQDWETAAATYTCDGTADNVQIQAAIDDVITAGGSVLLSSGNFNLAVALEIDGGVSSWPGAADEASTVEIYGAGTETTRLTMANNVDGIYLHQSPRVNIHDFSIAIAGSGDGITAEADAGNYRGFWDSSFKNLYISSADGAHSGWAMNLEGPFRSTFENIEAFGVGNGIRLASTDPAFNPGNCLFLRCFMDLRGADNGKAYYLYTPNAGGSFNICTFIQCEGIDNNAGSTTSVGWHLRGSATTYFATKNIQIINSNMEGFNTAVKLEHAEDNVIQLSWANAKDGGTLFEVDAESDGNELYCYTTYVAPGNTLKFIYDLNASTSGPTIAGKSTVYVDTGGTLSATLSATTIIKQMRASGTGTIASALQGHVLPASRLNLVDIAGTAPTTGQVLTATSATAAHWADASGGGASTALDNLASVAINTSLVSDTDSTDNLGSSAKYWANAYIDRLYLNSTAYLDGTTAGQTSILGNFLVSDNPSSPSKQYRFRTSGGALDLEAGGADIYLSTWSGVGFTGTQYQQIQFSASGGDMAFSQTFYSTAGGKTVGRSGNYWTGGYFDRLYLNSTAYIDGASAGIAGLTGALTITDTTATSLAVGRNGATNPAFTVDSATASSATGLKIKSAAAAAGLALTVTSSGTNENMTLDAKGSGTLTLQGTATGGIILAHAVTLSDFVNIVLNTTNGSQIGTATTQKLAFYGSTPIVQPGATIDLGVVLSNLGLRAAGTAYTITTTGATALGATTITDTSATSLTVGRNGATNPGFTVDSATASSATGIKVKSAAAAGGVAVSVTSSGTNENLAVDAKGSGTITLGATSTGEIFMGRTVNIVANNLATDGTFGMRIGTATTQKLGFFNATPIVQVGATIDLGVVLSNLGFRAAGTAYPITTSGALTLTGTVNITDVNVVLGTTTGTKFGTATTQKLSFYNSTPIVQPAATVDVRTALGNLGLLASGTNPLNARVNTTASSATPAINQDTTDEFDITALAVDITSMTSGLTGTPVNGQELMIRIKGTATRAITWGANFQSSGVATLLATTSGTKTHFVKLRYDSTAAKWICMAVDATGY